MMHIHPIFWTWNSSHLAVHIPLKTLLWIKLTRTFIFQGIETLSQLPGHSIHMQTARSHWSSHIAAPHRVKAKIESTLSSTNGTGTSIITQSMWSFHLHSNNQSPPTCWPHQGVWPGHFWDKPSSLSELASSLSLGRCSAWGTHRNAQAFQSICHTARQWKLQVTTLRQLEALSPEKTLECDPHSWVALVQVQLVVNLWKTSANASSLWSSVSLTVGWSGLYGKGSCCITSFALSSISVQLTQIPLSAVKLYRMRSVLVTRFMVCWAGDSKRGVFGPRSSVSVPSTDSGVTGCSPPSFRWSPIDTRTSIATFVTTELCHWNINNIRTCCASRQHLLPRLALWGGPYSSSAAYACTWRVSTSILGGNGAPTPKAKGPESHML